MTDTLVTISDVGAQGPPGPPGSGLDGVPYINITKKFGVIPDGTDRTAEMNDALTNTPTAARLFIDTSGQPGGTGVLVLDEVAIGGFNVGDGRQLSIGAIPRSLWIQALNPAGRAIRVMGDSRIPSTFFELDGIGFDIPADRPYDVPIFEIDQIRNWEFSRTHLRANQHTGLFVLFDGSYEGTWRSSYGYVDKFAVPYRFTTRMNQPNGTLNKPPQADTCHWDRVTWMGLCGGIFENSGNETHGQLFSTYKVVNNTGGGNSPRIETMLTHSVIAGDNTLQVLNTDMITHLLIGTTRDDTAAYGTLARSGVKVGDMIAIGQGGDLYINKVVAYDPTGVDATNGLLTLAQPIPRAYDIATHWSVRIAGGIGLAFGTIHNVGIEKSHFESLGTAVDVTNTGPIEINAHHTCHELVRTSGATHHATVRAGQMGGTDCANWIFFRNNQIHPGGDNFYDIIGPVYTAIGAPITAVDFGNETGPAGAFGSKDRIERKTLNNHVVNVVSHGSANALTPTAEYSYGYVVDRSSGTAAGLTSNGRVVAAECVQVIAKVSAGARLLTADLTGDGVDQLSVPGAITGDQSGLIGLACDPDTGQAFLCFYVNGHWFAVEGGQYA